MPTPRTSSPGCARPAQQGAVADVVSIFDQPDLTPTLVSADGTTLLVQISYTAPVGSDAANAAIDAIRAHLAVGRPTGLATYLTGQAAINRDLFATIRDSIDRTTLVTVLLVLAVLLLIYRAPLAAGVPLVTIGVAFLIARGVLGLLVEAGWKVSSMVEAFLVVLIFGAGTDYALFLISRYREELAARPAGRDEAVVAMVARIGPVIAASGTTVILGTFGMIVARFELVHTQGPAMAAGIAIALLASLTLTPALLSVLGRRLFWPARPRPDAADAAPGRGWQRVAAALAARPGRIAAVVTVLLLGPALALPALQRSFNAIEELPPGVESRQGFEVLGAHFGQGELLPVTVLFTGTASLRTPAGLATVGRLDGALAAVPGVARVRSLVHPTGGQDPALEQGLLARTQVLTLTARLAASFAPAAAPAAVPAAPAAPDPHALDGTAAYLRDLGAGFPDVAAGPAYAEATAALAGLRSSLAAQAAAMQVTTQVNGLLPQVGQLAAALAPGAPAAVTGPALTAAAGRLPALQRYLEELAAAYPTVRQDPAWLQATGALATILPLLAGPPAGRDPAAVRPAVADLQTGLQALAAAFAGRDAPFVPSVAAGGHDPAAGRAALQPVVGRLTTALTGLAAALPADAAFLPPSLTAAQPALQRLLAGYLAPDGTATQVQIVLAGEPYGEASFAAVQQIGAVAADQGAPAGLTAYTAGPLAEVRDIHTLVDEDFWRVLAVVVGGVLLVFILLLRCLAAPLYLVGTVLFSYATSMGLMVLLFQGLLGRSGINYVIPTIILVLLIALGADYNIFLISRVWEEAVRQGDVRAGVRVAAARTGSVITSAGLILAGTFAALALAPMPTLMEVGVGVALGVLVDTFVVRALLVPALAALLGRWNWWPAAGPVAAPGAVRPPAAPPPGRAPLPRHGRAHR